MRQSKPRKGDAMDGSNKQSNPDLQTGFAFGYLVKNTEVELNSIAATSRGTISGQQLAQWLGAFLLAKADGTYVGATDHVSSLRRQTTTGGKAVEPMALVNGSRRSGASVTHRRLSAKARKNISRAQKARWAKLRQKSTGIKEYWAKMSPTQRKGEMRRRMKVRLQKVA
jgi:hypothetical protein